MDLKHDPAEGITVDEDLSKTEITLTRKRGGDVLVALFTAAAMLLGAWVTRFDVWIYGGVFMGLAGLLANQVKTTVALGPHALRVEGRTFGLQKARHTVPYAAIRAIGIERGALSSVQMRIERVDADDLVIPHGTDEDLEALRRAIDARRPIGPAPEAAELAGPEALQQLRGRQAE